jgi:hypothetical protein
MPYIGQFDGLLPAQDNDRRVQNIRTMAVFTDGLVICAVGFRAVRGRRQKAIRKRALRLGPNATAAAFARTRRKALAIPFADVTGIALTQTSEGKQLVVHAISPSTGQEQAYPYRGDLPANRVREVLGPLIGARLTIAAQA